MQMNPAKRRLSDPARTFMTSLRNFLLFSVAYDSEWWQKLDRLKNSAKLYSIYFLIYLLDEYSKRFVQSVVDHCRHSHNRLYNQLQSLNLLTLNLLHFIRSRLWVGLWSGYVNTCVGVACMLCYGVETLYCPAYTQTGRARNRPNKNKTLETVNCRTPETVGNAES